MNAQPEDPQPEPIEPAEPEPTPEPEPEPEPELEPTEPEAPPVQAAQTEKEIKKRQDALAREAERHAGRVNEILGEDALGLIPCEACPPTVAGWHYPADAYPPGDPSRTLYEFLAMGDEQKLRHPDRYVRCETCDGAGWVETGARPTLESYKIVCPDCKAAGFFDTAVLKTAPVVTLPTAAGAEQPSSPPIVPEQDFLGRPAGHANYGKMTSYMTPAELAVDQRDGFGLG